MTNVFCAQSHNVLTAKIYLFASFAIKIIVISLTNPMDSASLAQ